MVFLGIYRALYDYVPQGVGELAIKEGDLLFVLEKSSDDDWWRAKKKAPNEEEEEPEGLVPNNYLEEVSADIRTKLEHCDLDDLVQSRLPVCTIPDLLNRPHGAENLDRR